MSINTISNNYITGSIEEIQQAHGDIGFSEAQGYFFIGCSLVAVTIIGIVLVITIGRIVQTFILKFDYLTKKQREELKQEILEELKK